MKQIWKSSLGVLFDHRAETGKSILFRLSRPMDIDPLQQKVLDVEALAQCVRNTASALHAAGVRPGDRFAVYKENHFDCLLLAAAGIRIGAIPVMLSGLLPPDTVRPLLQRTEPTLLVSNRRLLEAQGSDGSLLTSFADRTLCLDGGVPNALALADVLGGVEPTPVARGDDELMMLTHTSGTTGIPKLVMYTPEKLQGQMARLECNHVPPITDRREDTIAMFLPFSHVRSFTWIYSVLYLSPTKVLLMSENDPEVVGPMFRLHRPTVIEALPIDFLKMLELTKENQGDAFAAVRMYIGNFDAMRWSAIRAFLNASQHPFPLWREGYGQSETGGMGMTVITRRRANKRRDQEPGPRKVGRPMPGFVSLKVVDPETFKRVPKGQPGVVLAKTKARCVGYYKEPERWNEKAIGDWWNTGDIGIMTRTGAIKLLDREVNYAQGMSCLELEDTIVDYLPEGFDVAVLPVAESLPVPVVAAPDGELDRKQWEKAVRGRPALAEPIVINFKEMPRTGTGKIQREELRRRYLAGAGNPGTGRWT